MSGAASDAAHDGTRPGDHAEHWLEIFLAVTDARPDVVYARSEDGELTYGALRASADRLASALLAGGVRPRDVVAVWMTNSLELIVAQWAIYRAGCAMLPLYSYYREAELRHALTESRAPVLITTTTGALLDVDGGWS